MTTIAYRFNILAADSQISVDTEGGGSRKFKCEKLYNKDGAIIALAGDSTSGLIFLDWYGTGKRPSSRLIDGDADFTALVLRRDGLFEYDKWCRGDKILEEFYAIGSGAKAALGAMHMGADAVRAVEIACLIDTYSSPPVKHLKLGEDNAQ